MALPGDRPQPRGDTSAQLRDDIDSGRTGDKTPGLDPAAAPLGTDAEAAGTPPSAAEIAAARAAEARGRGHHAPNAANPDLAPDGVLPRRRHGPRGVLVLAALIAVILIVFWLILA